MQLLFWRAVLGIGMGGEWASGAVLVSETWPAHLRNKAISIMQSGWALGYMMASISAAIILGAPSLGADAWRWLFVVGVIPAFFTLWIRRYVHEPESWTRKPQKAGGPSPFAVIFGRTLIGRTLLIIALGSAVQFANWGLFFWLPAFLARPVEQGGAGMGVVGSLPWIIPVQLGVRRLPHVRLHRRQDRTTTGVRATWSARRCSCRSTARWRGARSSCSRSGR